MRLKKIDIALPEIRKFFKSSTRVFNLLELKSLLLEQKWDLPVKMYIGKFIEVLKEKRILREISLKFTQETTLFITQDANVYDIASRITTKMYLSHYTAAHLHQLTEQIPKTIYTSKEFSPQGGYSPPGDEAREDLPQNAIDAAMQKEARVTQKRATYKQHEIVFLNSKHVGDLGIVDLNYNDTSYRVTSIERTLIDVAMRPDYCGGISEVLNCFVNAHHQTNVNKIVKLLLELDYIYPYHQVLGFYLTRTGVYSGEAIDRLKKFGLNHDFYLCHGFKKEDLSYDKDWKLFYPGWIL